MYDTYYVTFEYPMDPETGYVGNLHVRLSCDRALAKLLQDALTAHGVVVKIVQQQDVEVQL